MKAIKNVRIYDFENYIEHGYVIFSETIEEIGRMEHFNFTGQVIDGKGKLLMPGLINAHTHSYSILSRGKTLPVNKNSFSQMLKDKWWKFDRQLTLDSIYYSGIINGIESIKNGVTTVIDHHASGEIKNSIDSLKSSICGKLKMRGIFCFETSDRFDIDLAIKENLRVLKKNNKFYGGLFGLHASFSLSNETLKKVSDALEGYPIHVHVAESNEDELRSLHDYNKRVIERFNAFNLLNDDSILAHCVHIDATEAKILEDKNVYIALNPSSNLNNNVGIFDYQLLKDHHLNIMLGTDGLSSNIAKEWFNFYLLIKKSLNSIEGETLDQMLEYINNTYDYVSRRLNIKLGRIRKGYEADMILVDYKPPTKMYKANAFSHIFFGAFQNFKPSDAFVAGHRLLSHYEVSQDEEQLYEEARKVADQLWQRVGD